MRWSWLVPVFAATAAASVTAAGSDGFPDRPGTALDRGVRPMVGLDKIRAAEHDLAPVVQFLTFIQDRRQDPSHMLFVRMDDIDALAADSGEEATAFLSRLDQLGVVVSDN